MLVWRARTAATLPHHRHCQFHCKVSWLPPEPSELPTEMGGEIKLIYYLKIYVWFCFRESGQQTFSERPQCESAGSRSAKRSIDHCLGTDVPIECGAARGSGARAPPEFRYSAARRRIVPETTGCPSLPTVKPRNPNRGKNWVRHVKLCSTSLAFTVGQRGSTAPYPQNQNFRN